MHQQLERETEIEEVPLQEHRETPAHGYAENPLLPSVTIGLLVATDPEHGPMVDFVLNHSGAALPARTLVPIAPDQVGRDVALVFEDGEQTRPVIVGVVQEWNPPVQHKLAPVQQAEARVTVQHDDDSLLLTAAKEITLQCGKASITLTSAGKLLLRGAYLLSRSSGVNRIKGGSVQIN